MKRVRIAAIASLLAGCTVNVPNGTFNTNASVTATANTQVNAQVNTSTPPSTPAATPTELPPIVLSPSPTPQATSTPSPAPQDVASPDVWRYSARDFEFLYPKGWDSVETGPLSNQNADCVAAINRKSPTGFTYVAVFRPKQPLLPEDYIGLIKASPDNRVTDEKPVAIGGIESKAIWWIQYENGVEIKKSAAYVNVSSRLYEVVYSTSEPDDKLEMLSKNIDITFNSWKWK